MAMGKDWKIDRLETDNVAVFESSRFMAKERGRSCSTVPLLLICASISFVCVTSLVSTNARNSNFSTYYNVLLLPFNVCISERNKIPQPF